MSDLSPLSGEERKLDFGAAGPLMTQAVWKRFSYPNNCKQPGVMDLDATV
jgi:hypothetical protein